MNRRHATSLIGFTAATMLMPSRAWAQSASNPLVGFWELVALEDRRAPDASFAFGPGSRGIIMYLPIGYMAVQIWRVPQPTLPTQYDKATLIEIKTAYEAFYAYNGKYDVDIQKHIVTHHVEASLRPGETGRNYQRAFEVSENQLTLTPMREDGTPAPAHLTWRRIAS